MTVIQATTNTSKNHGKIIQKITIPNLQAIQKPASNGFEELLRIGNIGYYSTGVLLSIWRDYFSFYLVLGIFEGTFGLVFILLIQLLMNTDQRRKEQLEIQAYLQSKKVYHFLDDLLQSLIINKPKNPLDFLINNMQEKEQKRIFIVGPPGFRLQELALSIADSYSENNESKLNTFSVGDQINKEFGKKQGFAQSIQVALKNFQYVADDTVISIVKSELENYQRQKKNYIIQGFPKTRAQGVFLRNLKIFPTTFLIINLREDRIIQCCFQKLNNSQNFKHLAPQAKFELAKLHQIQYSLHIQKVKDLYKGNYFQIDSTYYKNVQAVELLEEADRILKFKLKVKAPKNPLTIVLTGAPCSGRTSLGHNLCAKYGFVFISTAELISHEINIKSNDGLKLKDNFARGELVDEIILLRLLRNRIRQKDCLIQGFVLDGFPKVASQLQILKQLRITPSLFITLLASPDVSLQRKKNSHIGQSKQQGVEEFKTRINRWKDFLAHIETNYNNHLLKLNAELPMKNVFENACFHLENI